MKPKRKYRKSALSDSQKEEIALEYLTTTGSYRTVGEKYGVTKLQVRHCVVWHKHNELLAAVANPGIVMHHSPKTEELRQQVKRLSRQLQIARLKSEAYEMMIDHAEKEYNVDIRKKHGSRQPNNLDANTPK